MTANSHCSVAESPGLETQRREIECLLRESELQAGDSWKSSPDSSRLFKHLGTFILVFSDELMCVIGLKMASL
ncbi:hypothetical protein ILYODFUR_023974 [Ilyodon furcidens]|uniref:Uncharacterized protein n=1 Tax=Ilyodon furcidens TaxID=33524 RepID=A0ABV0SP44_9TELE